VELVVLVEGGFIGKAKLHATFPTNFVEAFVLLPQNCHTKRKTPHGRSPRGVFIVEVYDLAVLHADPAATKECEGSDPKRA
jgi:hypothetical protein